MFKFLRKPKWTTIPADLIRPGNVVSRGLIVGPVLTVDKIEIQGHDYVCLRVDLTEPGEEHWEGKVNLLPNTLVKVIQK